MKILDQNLQKLIKAGVYKKEDEHDACGVGFVASIDGKPRREVVENGIEAPHQEQCLCRVQKSGCWRCLNQWPDR